MADQRLGTTCIEVIPGAGFIAPEDLNLPEKVGAFEKYLIEEELRKNNAVMDATFKSLGIPRKTLYDKMKKYNIKNKKSFSIVMLIPRLSLVYFLLEVPQS